MSNLNNTQNSNMNNQYSYEQKKNNGKGIFYGVIAVATLIVAIIGATFAYFTAAANSSDNALSAVAAHVEVNYSEGRQIKATNLIPSSAEVVRLAYLRDTAYAKNIAAGCTHVSGLPDGATDSDGNEINIVTEADPESTTSAANWYEADGDNWKKCSAASSTGDVGTKCVDDNGYYVCAVYQFSVTNTSNVKQALQAYLTINENTFTTPEMGADTLVEGNQTTPSNRALKFMTVRSASVIDVNAISSAESGDTCSVSTLTNMNVTNPSVRFCNSDGTADDADKTTFTDTSGTYYYFNTTAVRQSLLPAGQTQTVFTGEVVPSIDANYLTASNGILYMHTVEQTDTASITTVGPSDSSTAVGTIYADTNGNSYADQATCTSAITGQYGVTCQQVYLSANSLANAANADNSDSGDVVLGAYGQVTRTFYVVAWLEESDVSQDVDQDKSFAATINVTSGTLGSAGITGTINP